MKNTILILLFIIFASCESKEDIEKQIAILKVEIIELERHDAILNYKNALENLKTEKFDVKFNKEQLEKEKLNIEPSPILIDLYCTAMKGAENRVRVAKERLKILKLPYNDVLGLVEIKKKEISDLKQKLE